jgi:hypothetical protein
MLLWVPTLGRLRNLQKCHLAQNHWKLSRDSLRPYFAWSNNTWTTLEEDYFLLLGLVAKPV